MQTEDRLIGDSTAIFLRAGIFISGIIAVATHPAKAVYWQWQWLLVAGSALYLMVSSLALLKIVRNPKDTGSITALVCLDVILISICIWALPGHNSIIAMLYYIPVLYAATRLDFRSCITAAVLGALSYLFVSIVKETPANHFIEVFAFAFSSLVLASILGMLYAELYARKRLADSLAASLKRLSAVYDVARAAWDDAYSFEDIVRRVLQEVSALAKTENCFVALLDREGRFQISSCEGAQGRFVWESALAALKTEQETDPLLESLSLPEAGGATVMLTMPMRSAQEIIGVVQIQRKEPFRRRELEIVHALCTEVAVALENARLRRELVRLATTDTVTGLLTRAEFSCRLAAEMKRAAHAGHPLSVLMLDIDDFKNLNDRSGHAAGDCILAKLADILRAQLRPADSAGRWGGDEFCVLLPETALEGSLGAAERLRTEFRAAARKCEKDLAQRLGRTFGAQQQGPTLSIGVVSTGDPGFTSEELLSFADRALYAAKHAGRDTIRAFVIGGGNELPPPQKSEVCPESYAGSLGEGLTAPCQARAGRPADLVSAKPESFE